MEALQNLGIDVWSLILHTVNILFLVGVLTVLLYKPLMRFMNERQQQIQGSIQEAEILKKEFEERLAQMESEKNAMRADFDAQMSQGKKDLESLRGELIQDMEDRKAKLLEEATQDIAARKERLLEETKQEVLGAMSQIVTAVVGASASEADVKKSVEDEWSAFFAPHKTTA